MAEGGPRGKDPFGLRPLKAVRDGDGKINRKASGRNKSSMESTGRRLVQRVSVWQTGQSERSVRLGFSPPAFLFSGAFSL